MDDSITVPRHAVSPPGARSAGMLPSPSEDVVLLFALEEIKMFEKQTNMEAKNISCRNTSFTIRKAPDYSQRPGDEASVVDRSDDDDACILSETSWT